MRKFTNIVFIAVLFFGISTASANAQAATGGQASDINWNEIVEHTLREEKEGKELWEKFSAKGGQAKEITCAEFSDEQFGVLGEYFMGRMMGDSHAAMNAMLIQMHGEEGEEQSI